MRKFRKSHMRPFSWRSSKNASMPKPSMLAVCVCVCECAEAVDARVFDAVSSHACRCVAPRAVEARAVPRVRRRFNWTSAMLTPFYIYDKDLPQSPSTLNPVFT
jgi:hypothetical protein